jgi:sugar phosphate isomerase/epimerase
MKKAVQQIMLGTVTGSEAAARATLQRIKAAGYDGLELNRFMIHPTSLMVRMMTKAAGMPTGKGGRLDWKKLLREADLSVVSLHTDLGSLEREADAVAAEARELGTDKLVITGMYRFDYGDEKAVRELASRLNRAGEGLRKAGLSLLYHNHNVELLQVKPGLRAYDLLLSETDPDCVGFEFDSYWFTDGGADAKEWMRRLGERMKLWHVTDRGARQSGPAMTPILKCDSMELGTGNMDLDGLRAIAVENGIGAVVLESHKNWIDRDPIKSLELSAKWLNGRF